MTTVTIAANHGAFGGGEVMLINLAEAMRELGRSVVVVAPREPGEVLAQGGARGFETVAIPGSQPAAYLRNLRRWDAEERRGLLWCNGLRPAVATAGHPRRVVELHQRPAARLAPLAAVALRSAERVLVPSSSMRESVPDAEVLWNWTEEISPRTQQLHRTDDVVTLGYLGRLSPDKGVITLCQAVELLDRRAPGRFRLLIAGEGRFVDRTATRRVDAALARIEHLVDRRGWLDRKAFFDEADLAVFPSIWSEPFGLVAAEAMSARCPFVISDAGALAEVAGPDYPWIARAGDPAILADVIEAAAAGSDEDQLDSLRSRWERLFSPTAGRERLRSHLDDLAPSPATPPRVALAHDYFTQRGGAERVVLAMLDAFPDAPVTTSVYTPQSTYPELAQVTMRTAWTNRIPLLHHDFRLGLPLYAAAFRSIDAGRDADVVIASSTAFAHGVRSGVPKIVYCHSPARFLYLIDDYVGGPWWTSPSGWLLRALRPALARSDQRAARSADRYLCNSMVVQERIRRIYGIDATVVHPCATLDPDDAQTPLPIETPFHLLVSRLLPYKNVEVAIEAFRRTPQRHLVIVAAGPAAPALRRRLPSNVSLLEGITDAELRWAYANATAVIAPSFEDFGLTPVEGFRFGTPAITLRAGGYLETVVEGVSGWFFDEPTPEAILAAIEHLERHPIPSDLVQAHGEQFSPTEFSRRLTTAIEELL